MKTTTAAIPNGQAHTRSGTLTLLWCVLGLLVPRATLYGELAPFGIGLAAAQVGGLPALLCLAVGYLLAQPVLLPLRYVATVAMVGGIRWVLSALPELKARPFVPPLLGFVATALTGFVMLGQTGLDIFRGLLILAESGVAAGSALFFAAASRTAEGWRRGGAGDMTPGQQTAVIFTGAVGVMAASTLTVEGFAPGRVVAAFLILILARSGREAGGSLAGIILGGAMALMVPGQTTLAITLAFGGMMAGVFSRFGRLAEAALFLLTAGVVTLGEADDRTLFYLYEIFAAGVLFVLLPREADRRLSRLFIRSRDLPAVEGVRRMMTMRLQVASAALEEVSRSVAAVSRRLAKSAAPDVHALYRDTYEAVCGACPLQGVCWGQHAEEMRGALEALTPLLRQQGAVTPEQLTGYPATNCRRPDRLTEHISHGYAQHIAREGAWQRLQELQQAVEDQFAGTGELLHSLAARLEDPGQVDMELSGQVLAVCEDHGMTVRDALCTRDGGNRLTVDILTADGSEPPSSGRWLQRLEQVCGRRFAPPAVAEWGEHLRVTLTEPPRYRVEWGLAQMRSENEKLCGDTADVVPLEGGLLAVLSDGMGAGGRAAVDSAMAVGITSRLWQAGYSPAGILQTVNAALLVKSREETLATLDVAVIDTHTGRLDSYKAGAAVSLLRCDGRVSRLERSSLPIGILRDIRFEHSHDRLTQGDVLLLLSDGAIAGGVAPVEELLRDYPEEGDMQTLANEVMALAAALQPEHRDDITVVALRLVQVEE
ncbi:MAG: SpoIIE family protein phosphatase [Clostridia bacterium]|nr:SpoIIE family protein phosphatase [Clostridia bacterium]